MDLNTLKDLLCLGHTTNTARGLAKDPLSIVMTDSESEFALAMETYKKVNNRRFPAWSEALRILMVLGYRKTEEPKPIKEINTLIMNEG